MATMTRAKEQLIYRIELPFPVSANRLWATSRVFTPGKGSPVRVRLSPAYVSWIKEADGLWMAQKPPGRPVMLGAYRLALTFAHAKRRPNQDGDNLCKCVHDWLQRVELIKNDSLCIGGSWAWGDAPSSFGKSPGCLATLEGSPWQS